MQKGPVTPKGFRGFLTLATSKKTKVGIFIDEANLFYIQKELDWKIDWEKFADLFKENFDLKILRYYLGMPTSGDAKIKNLKIKSILESFGYTVVTKPLKKIYTENGKFKYKCNFDVEIALDVATFVSDLDLVIIVSADSDFVAIKDFVLMNKRHVLFLCFERKVSWEIRKSKYLFFEKIRKLVEFNKKPRQRGRGEITKSSISNSRKMSRRKS